LKKIPLYGDGKQIRDWLFVEDHISALINIANSGERFSCFNIGGNNQITNLELVNKICEKMDDLVPLNAKTSMSSYKDLIEFVSDRPGHDKRYAIDSKKIQTELNWYPKTNFDEGLERTIRWYISHC
ncbi:MAG: GDP-mannose 4,6-dehydratase, partial [Gammaproteobacteria bacterium]